MANLFWIFLFPWYQHLQYTCGCSDPVVSFFSLGLIVGFRPPIPPRHWLWTAVKVYALSRDFLASRIPPPSSPPLRPPSDKWTNLQATFPFPIQRSGRVQKYYRLFSLETRAESELHFLIFASIGRAGLWFTHDRCVVAVASENKRKKGKTTRQVCFVHWKWSKFFE